MGFDEDIALSPTGEGAIAACRSRQRLARFTSNLAKDGFFEEDDELWTRDGTLVAQSRQLALLLPVT